MADRQQAVFFALKIRKTYKYKETDLNGHTYIPLEFIYSMNGYKLETMNIWVIIRTFLKDWLHIGKE